VLQCVAGESVIRNGAFERPVFKEMAFLNSLCSKRETIQKRDHSKERPFKRETIQKRDHSNERPSKREGNLENKGPRTTQKRLP